MQDIFSQMVRNKTAKAGKIKYSDPPISLASMYSKPIVIQLPK